MLMYLKYDIEANKSSIKFTLENGELISIQHIKNKLDELAGNDTAEDAEDAVQDSAEVAASAVGDSLISGGT
eukprot:705213-Hanusia_phi.AAC.1